MWTLDLTNKIHQALTDLADQGSSILIISQDLDEILSLCEQVHVINNGKLSPSVDMESNGLETISQLMLGASIQ